MRLIHRSVSFSVLDQSVYSVWQLPRHLVLGELSLLISIRNDWISQRVILLLISTFLYVYFSFFHNPPISSLDILYRTQTILSISKSENLSLRLEQPLPTSDLRPSAFGANKQGPKEGDEDVETYCARIAAKLCGDLDIPAMGPGAIDLTIEASGAPTCIQIGVHVLKPAYVHLSSSSLFPTLPISLFHRALALLQLASAGSLADE